MSVSEMEGDLPAYLYCVYSSETHVHVPDHVSAVACSRL